MFKFYNIRSCGNIVFKIKKLLTRKINYFAKVLNWMNEHLSYYIHKYATTSMSTLYDPMQVQNLWN